MTLREDQIKEIMKKGNDALTEYLFEDMTDTELDERLFALKEYWWDHQYRNETRDQECLPDWCEDYKFWY